MNGWKDGLLGRVQRALVRLSGHAAPGGSIPPPTSSAPSALPLSEAVRTSHRDLLARAGGFGGWRVGAAAAPIPELTAFRELLTDPQAAETAHYLLDHGAPGGIAYGLSLLWLVDHPSFLVECPRFRDHTGAVILRWGGCMPGGEEVPLSQLVSSPTAIKLRGPGDTIEAWMARHPGQDGGADIEGGGYPLQLAGP
jgi:hypothetical protein